MRSEYRDKRNTRPSILSVFPLQYVHIFFPKISPKNSIQFSLFSSQIIPTKIYNFEPIFSFNHAFAYFKRRKKRNREGKTNCTLARKFAKVESIDNGGCFESIFFF